MTLSKLFDISRSVLTHKVTVEYVAYFNIHYIAYLWTAALCDKEYLSIDLRRIRLASAEKAFRISVKAFTYYLYALSYIPCRFFSHYYLLLLHEYLLTALFCLFRYLVFELCGRRILLFIYNISKTAY